MLEIFGKKNRLEDSVDIIISVIVPVYNMEQYLKKCIDSIINQSFKDFELIIVNDGSTDGSMDILSKYKKEHTNIVIINKSNEGLGEARNTALEVCRGEYIAFVDSDDYIDSNMLQKMYEKSKKFDLDIVICNYNFVDINGGEARKNDIILDDNEIIDSAECIKIFLTLNTIQGFSWNKLYKKKLFDSIRYPGNMSYEDIPTIVSLMIDANRVGFIDQRLYNYLLRDDSISATRTKKNIYDYIYAHYMVGQIITDKLGNDFIDEFDYFYSKRIGNVVYGFLRSNVNEEDKKIFTRDVSFYVRKINKIRIFFRNKYYKKKELISVLVKIFLYQVYYSKIKYR